MIDAPTTRSTEVVEVVVTTTVVVTTKSIITINNANITMSTIKRIDLPTTAAAAKPTIISVLYLILRKMAHLASSSLHIIIMRGATIDLTTPPAEVAVAAATEVIEAVIEEEVTTTLAAGTRTTEMGEEIASISLSLPLHMTTARNNNRLLMPKMKRSL